MDTFTRGSHGRHVARSSAKVRRLEGAIGVALSIALFIGSTITSVIMAETPADAASVTINMGESRARQRDVTTNAYGNVADAYTYACVRYDPQGAGYSTSWVTPTSTTPYASYGYGNSSSRCPDSYNPSTQSSVGLRPGTTTSVEVGKPFLVATMRHINRPIVLSGAGNPTKVYGTMDMELGNVISSTFPWTLTETTNTCRSTFDSQGRYVPEGTGQYAFNQQGQVGLRAEWRNGRWSTNYHYAYNSTGQLVSFPNGDGPSANAIYGSDGRSCADDNVKIAAASSSTAWTDTSTGITYKLKLWGFVNNGANETCSTGLAPGPNSALESTFVTKENATTYGCLFGSMEQVRSITFAKEVTTSPDLQSTVTIPTFTYQNVSQEGATALSWGDPSSLKPSGWGPAGTAHDPKTYELLAPVDMAIIKENLNPALTETTSGWKLTGVDCVLPGNDNSPLLNSGGQVLTKTDALDLEARTLRLNETELAQTTNQLNIKCTWKNEYVGRSKLTLVKQVHWSPNDPVSTDNWTLTATPTTGSTTVSGLSGTTAVTGVVVTAGEYTLSETFTGSAQGFVQDGPWVCKDKNGAALAVTDSKVLVKPDDHVTCTVLNRFQTGSITINKTVTDPESGLTNSNKAFTGTYDCGTVNGKPYTGTWSATTSTPAVITGIPVGQTCTITEDTPTGDLKDSSYEWSAPSISPNQVTVPLAPATGQVTVTNAIVRNTGSLTINKVVTPQDASAAGGWTGSPARAFPVTYTCTMPGSGDVFTNTVNATTGTPVTVGNLPAGSTCTFSEASLSTQQGDFADGSYEWVAGTFAPASVTIPKDQAASTTVTNAYRRVLVPLNIAKTVSGDGYTGAGATFAINYDCGTGYSGTVNVANGASQTIQVPRGALCTVVEPDSSKDENLLDPAYDWGTQSYAGLDAGNGTMVDAGTGGKTVTVTNPTVAAWGKVSVTKSVTPSANPVTAGTTFAVTVTCDKPAQGQSENYSGTFNLTATGSTNTATTPYIRAGATCTVSEAAPAGSAGLTDISYTWATGPADQNVTVQGADTTAVTVANTWVRAYGDVNITKVLNDLDGQGSDNTYTGTLTCTHAGDADVTKTWSVTGEGGAALDGPQILLGSTCTATENNPGNPNDADTSYVFTTWGTTSGPVTVSDAANPPTITVSNTVGRTTGGLTVTKAVTGTTAGVGFEDTNFTFDYTCTPRVGPAITGVITTKAGAVSDPVTGIPEGATCVITERTDALPTAIDPFRWDEGGTTMTATPSTGSAVSQNGNSVTVVMPGGDTPGIAVSATNTMSKRYGAVTVTKTVADTNKANGFTGGTDAIFPMTLTCGNVTVDTFNLADGGSKTVTNIPLGDTCTVTEGTISGGLADGSYSWGTPQISAPVKVTTEGATASGTITVTNTIDRVRADISLEKKLGNDLATQFGADNVYSGSVTCTHAGDPDVLGTWTVTGAGTADISWVEGEKPFVDSTCTPTEELASSGNPDEDPSYSWGTPTLTPATVTTANMATMEVINTVNRDMGSLTGAKVVDGETDGLKPGQTFTLNATCTPPSGTGQLTATATVGAGQSGVAFDQQIPAGWTCAFTETSPTADQLKDASYRWSAQKVEPATATITKDGTVHVTATNTIARVTSAVSVTKEYGLGLTDPNVVVDNAFGGKVLCTYDQGLPSEEAWALTWSVNGTGAATLSDVPQEGLPIGTVCEVTENALVQSQLKDVSYRWKEPVLSANITIGVDAQANAFTVTNDVERVAKPITITKTYAGPAAGIKADAVVKGAWTCTQADNTTVGGRWELPAAGGSVTVEAADADPTQKIFAGATCSITEDTPIDTSGLADASWAWTTPTYEVAMDGATFTAGSQLAAITQDANATLKVTNSAERIYGSLSIDKVVQGLDSIAAATSNTYSGTWSCTAEDGTANTGTWSVTGAGGAVLTGDYTRILVGSTCTVTETARPIWPVNNDVSYVWSDPDLDSDYGTVTQPAVIARDAESKATVTNIASPRQIASAFWVKKAITGASDGSNATDFEVAYSCTAGVDTITGTVTVPADGTPVRVTGVPAGATCTLTETPPASTVLHTPASGSFSWTRPVTYLVEGTTADTTVSGAVSFTLPADPAAAVTATVTNDVIAHAGVTKAFVAATKHLDGDGNWTGETWDLTYKVTVINPSTMAATTYDLVDNPTLPANTTLNSISATGGALVDPVSANSGPLTIVTGATLGAGETHTYTVVLNVSSTDVGVPGISDAEACTVQAATDGKAVHNLATVTSKTVTSTAEGCGNVPINPKFRVDKDKVDVVRSGDSYTATYTVTVANTSNADSQIIADVTDTPVFPATAKITGVTVSEGGQAAADAVIPAINEGVLAGPITLARANSGPVLVGNDGHAGGADERVITVAITFTVDSSESTYDDSVYQCVAATSTTPATGLINTVSMTGDSDGEENNTACLELSPKLKVTKSVSTPGVGTTSTFWITYRITVINEGELAQNTGVITDTPDFAPGLDILAATLADNGGAAQSVTADPVTGAYTLTNGVVLTPGATHSFDLSFQVKVDPGNTSYDEELLDCAVEENSTINVPGNGLFNEVLPAEGRDWNGRVDNTACDPVTTDAGKRPLRIVKTGSQGNLDGAEFAIYTQDPTTPGAAPIANAVIASSETGIFTTVNLAINRDYWLVETKAPAGHSLLAKALKFHLTDTQIQADDTGFAAGTITISAVGGDIQNTITVKDTEMGTLPLTGGLGIIPNIALTLALLAAAGWIHLTSLRRRHSGE